MISWRERRKWEGLFRREFQRRTAGVWGDEGFLLAEDWHVHFLVEDPDSCSCRDLSLMTHFCGQFWWQL